NHGGGRALMATRLARWLALALLVAAAHPAAAAVNFTVNETNDAVDANPGDGVCDVDLNTPGDQCTLRAAIQEANLTPPFDPDDPKGVTITLLVPTNPTTGKPIPTTYALTIAGAGEDAGLTGDLDILRHISIQGSESPNVGSSVTFIDGKKLKDRVFDVHPGGALDLRRVTVENGKTSNKDADPSGGCI